jgi:nicotinamide-nucleotide adenylyltransferase
MRGLVIGRFQPLHKGHEAVIKAAIEDCVHVTIGVGSSQAKQSLNNPFSTDERIAMLRAVFGASVDVIAIPDIHDPPNYAHHVVDIVGPVDRVFGNDEETVSLFEDAGYRVKRSGLEKRALWEGKTVRMQMAEGDGAWRKSLSAPVVTFIEQIDGSKRLRLLERSA